MSENRPGAPPLKKLGAVRRRSVSVSSEDMVRSRPLFDGRLLPLLVEPSLKGLNLAAWAADHRDFIEGKLTEHGGILFRGFDVHRAGDLERVIEAVSDNALEYRERSSPRSAVEGRIYTSTDYPPNYPIFLHNENSYQQSWPLKIFFLCETAASQGGETPIADTRRIYESIDPAVRERFERLGWMYVRNFGDGLGLDWREVFQTADRDQVEEHCRKTGIEVEWKEGGRLRTRSVRPAVSRHPKTGQPVWFNHATFFHVSTLEPEVRSTLLAEFSDEDLPTNTYYGDGSPIEPEVLEHLRSLYREETVMFPWHEGDLLLLDNMLAAHGRSPFQGKRRVLVGMAEPIRREDLQPAA